MASCSDGARSPHHVASSGATNAGGETGDTAVGAGVGPAAGTAGGALLDGGAAGRAVQDAGAGGRNTAVAGTAGWDSANAGSAAAGEAGHADNEPGPNREWALWPMPNPKSAGLPRPASYDSTTNTLVVKDLVTGLMWPHVLDREYHEFAPARATCQKLLFAGYDDWRLPTMIEMFSILDWTETTPAIDTSTFSAGGISFDLLWTTTPNPRYPDSGAWVMDLGYLSSFSTHPVNDRFPSFCVRGGSVEPAAAHYELATDTVLDAYTGLTWERHPSFTLYTQEEAADYCDALELGGSGEWRIPSLGETATLYAFQSISTPPMDLMAFPPDGASVSNVNFWGAGGWRFSFYNLVIRHSNDTPTARARCVH